MTTITKTERTEALDHLGGLLKPGDAVYTVLRHVSKSGMSRSIDVYMMVDNQPVYITGYAAKITDSKIDKSNGGIKMAGGGMDMGFALVYELSARLFPDGFEIKPGTYGRNGMTEHDPDGGYALYQHWL